MAATQTDSNNVDQEPNCKLRAIRIYASSDRWGESEQWSPPDGPYLSRDFPTPGSQIEVFFGPVPAEVTMQLRERDALLGAVMQKGWLGAEESMEELVASLLETERDQRVYDEPWYVSFVLDKPVYLQEDKAALSGRGWWERESAEAMIADFRQESKQVLDVAATHVSALIGRGCLDEETDDRDQVVLLREDKPLSVIPVFGASAAGTVVKGGAGFPSDDLRDRLGKLDATAWNNHRWLLRSLQWYTASLVAEDPWRRFQATWLALEILVDKAGSRYRKEVLEYLAYPESEAVSAVTELVGVLERASLTQKFAVIALALSPETADEDLAAFKRAKKGRNGVAHGDIANPDDLPTPDTRSLCWKYLDLVLPKLVS